METAPGTYIPGGGPGECAGSAYIWIGSANLGSLNGHRGYEVIQPGDVLTLNADHITDWVDPYATP